MNFDFTDDQQAIKRTAKEFLADRFKPERLRELAEAREYDDAVFTEMAELGWTGIFIPEDDGGQGLGILELVVVCEELGYALAPSPFLSSAAAALAILHAGSDEQRTRWLPELASGGARGSVADGPLAPDADAADVIVVIDDGQATLVEKGQAEVEPVETMDLTRKFGRVRAQGGEPLPGDLATARDAIAVALAAETVGVAQRTLEMTVEYVKDRKQFGRPIGSYQAVSHKCAEMLLEVESARSLAYYAGWVADHEPETLPLAAAMAKARGADAGWRVTAAALQAHGGIGFTWEHDLHFFLKRAKTNAHLFGSASVHRDRVAELAGLSAPVPA